MHYGVTNMTTDGGHHQFVDSHGIPICATCLQRITKPPVDGYHMTGYNLTDGSCDWAACQWCRMRIHEQTCSTVHTDSDGHGSHCCSSCAE